MKITKLHPSITLVTFPTQDALCNTFLRFQEHYESPKFRNKVFTLGQFKEWYSMEKGAFTYHSDWSGMNVPSYVFDAFRHGLFDPLTPEESALLNLFKHRTDKFYVIGTVEGDASAKGHELAHALYYVHPEYKKRIDEILYNISFSTYDALGEKLKELGYCDEVLADEIQAYCSEGLDGIKHLLPETDLPSADVCKSIAQLRDSFMGKLHE